MTAAETLKATGQKMEINKGGMDASVSGEQ